MALTPVLSFFLLWSLVSTASAFDITKILNQYPEYDVFNQELSKAGVADEINERRAVTVLVVSNNAMSDVTSQNQISIADIMRIHVVLDYYDSAKIKTLKDETTLTTLYQTTGSAEKEQGFIIVTKENNEINLGSAVSGSLMSARVNKVVTSVPYDISVIEISSPIIPTGMDDSEQNSTLSPLPSVYQSPSSSPSDSPADSSSDDTPATAPSLSDADAPSDDADADAPSDDDDLAYDVVESSSSRNAVFYGVMLFASFVAAL